jgi:hypothetical protein
MKARSSTSTRTRVRLVVRAAAVVGALLAVVAPALASGGSGSGGGTTTPPIQLSPDTTSLAAGASTVIQVVVSPAAPSGGETLSIKASSSSLTAPAGVQIAGGSSFGQFSVTGNAVSSPTPVSVTVSLGGSSATTSLTVTPATAAAVSSVSAFPSTVASGDPVTVDVSLSAAAPPGGLTVALSSDTNALPLPASAVVPAGSTLVQVSTTAGSVGAVTIAHLSASGGGSTAAGQVEIDPSRDLTAFVVSPTTTDGTKGSTGQVTISVPADGGNYAVALQSSNPAVAAVPASVAFLNGQQTASFPISTSPVDARRPRSTSRR